MERRRFFVGLCLGCAASALVAMPAAAQSGGEGARDRASGADIVVTARRVEERLQDVPISITVYSQEQLAKRNVVDAIDLAANTPSLSVNGLQGSLNASYALRGFVQDLGTQPSVGVYFADVVAPRAAANQFNVGDGNGPGSFMDLQNVQVLKGPQGTLFGRNTTGGAILLVPKKPTAEFEGYVEGAYGNYDMKRLQGVVNVPLSDVARLRIAAEYHDRDGYLKNYSGIGAKSYNDVGYYALRASLVVDLTPDLENYTIVTYAKADQAGSAQVISRGGSAMANGYLARHEAAGKGFFDVAIGFAQSDVRFEQWQVINTTTWQASDTLTVKNIASYAQLTQTLVSPFLGNLLDAHDASPLIPIGTPVTFSTSNTLPGYRTADQTTFTEELQLQGRSGDGALTWQAGGYVELSDPMGPSAIVSNITAYCPTADALLCTNPFGNGATSVTANETRFRNFGVYAQATYDLTDQLSLTGGIRYTWDKVSATGRNFRYGFPASLTPQPANQPPTCVYPDQVATDCALAATQVSKAPTWLIDLDYKPTDDILLYAKWTRGFRAGNLAMGLPSQFVRLRPEKLDAYEAGFKASFRGAVSGYFNVAAFYNDFSNQQASVSFRARPGVTGYPPKSGSTNIGKSQIYGAEVEGSVTLFDSLRLDLGYAYLKSKVRELDIPVLPPESPYLINSAYRVGDELTLTPRHKLSVSATYTLPLPESIGELSVGGTYTYTSQQVGGYAECAGPGGTLIPCSSPGAPPPAGLSLLPPRNLFDLNTTWKRVAGSAFDLAFFMTNITNEKYYVANILTGGPGGDTFSQVGQPRLFGARVRYSW